MDANAFLGVGSFLDTLYLHSNALQILADDAFKGTISVDVLVVVVVVVVVVGL